MTVRMERHLTWLVLWVLLALQAGCKEQPKPQPPPPPKVTIAQPVQQAVTDSLDLTGNTQAIYTVQLVARVVGYLEKVLFQDGQRVKKGQPLFVIQQNTYEDNLRQAEAAVLQYRAQLQWTESQLDRKSTRLNSSHSQISYAVCSLKKQTPPGELRDASESSSSTLRFGARAVRPVPLTPTSLTTAGELTTSCRPARPAPTLRPRTLT